MGLPSPSAADAHRARWLLSLDGGAGLTVGVLFLALAHVLAPWFRASPELLQIFGAVNLLYGACSGTLALRAHRGLVPRRIWIDLLIIANFTWTVVCAGLIFWLRGLVGPLTLAHLALEGSFVAVLALLERRWVRPWARP